MREANNIDDEPHESAARDKSGSQSESDETAESDYYYDDSTGYEVYRDEEDESAAEQGGQLDERPADV